MGKPRSIEEIAAEANEVASRLGIRATGQYEKRGNAWYFEFTNGSEYKWRTLGDLKKIRNHFNRSTFDQQLIEAANLSHRMGLSFTGEHNHLAGNARKFELSNGHESKWSTLGNLRAGKNPFAVVTLEQQLAEAKEYAKKLDLQVTGQSKLIKGSRKYEVSNGVDAKWTARNISKKAKAHSHFAA